MLDADVLSIVYTHLSPACVVGSCVLVCKLWCEALSDDYWQLQCAREGLHERTEPSWRDEFRNCTSCRSA